MREPLPASTWRDLVNDIKAFLPRLQHMLEVEHYETGIQVIAGTSFELEDALWSCKPGDVQTAASFANWLTERQPASFRHEGRSFLARVNLIVNTPLILMVPQLIGRQVPQLVLYQSLYAWTRMKMVMVESTVLAVDHVLDGMRFRFSPATVAGMHMFSGGPSKYPWSGAYSLVACADCEHSAVR